MKVTVAVVVPVAVAVPIVGAAGTIGIGAAFADGELPKDITATRVKNETALRTLFIALNIALSPKSIADRADLLKRHSGSLPAKGLVIRANYLLKSSGN